MPAKLPPSSILYLTLAFFLGIFAVRLYQQLVPEQNPLVAYGYFEGMADHAASGDVSLLRTPAGVVAVLGPSFSVAATPDPHLGFGYDGYNRSTEFAALNATEGAQIYPLPEHIDLEYHDEFWVWCEKFDVPLARARLKR